MTAILTWIQQNPQAVKAYMVSVLALIAKLILALTGKTSDLGQWSDFVNQAIDLLVGALTLYGVIAGSVHVSRGPSPTPVDQAAAIVAAITGPPVSAAVEAVKIATEVIASDKETPRDGVGSNL
jgi:hypothetical protein